MGARFSFLAYLILGCIGLPLFAKVGNLTLHHHPGRQPQVYSYKYDLAWARLPLGPFY
jgi:hypothetical protein